MLLGLESSQEVMLSSPKYFVTPRSQHRPLLAVFATAILGTPHL